MIPMIQQAVTMGYTAAQILKYIASKFKSASPGIASARQQGYSDEDILKFIGGKIKPKSQKNLDQQLSAQERYMKASGIKTKEEKEETRNKFISGALGVGATALGAYNIYKNYSGMMGGLSSVLGKPGNEPEIVNPPNPNSQGVSMPQGEPASFPNTSQPTAPLQPGPNIGQQIGDQAAEPVMGAMQSTSPNQIAQASTSLRSQPTQEPQSIFNQLLGGVDVTKLDPEKQKQLQFLGMIGDQLQSKGKVLEDPEFQSLAKRVKDTLRGKAGTIIQESARTNAAYPNPAVSEKKQTINPLEAAPLQPKGAKKGESVVTEDGNLVEVKGMAGDNFLIEENGKVKQVPMSSLRSEPEAIKKAKIVFDPSKIPEDDRSAALSISLPMPDRSAIVNMFHDGSFYLYKRKDGKPIDESIIKRIIEGQDIPISTGETFMGMWNSDKGDSRGSASYKELVSLAQDASQPDDPTKPLVFEKITNSYTHGYLKEFQRLLKEAGRQFSAKKPKK